jgi:hypothetical protein
VLKGPLVDAGASQRLIVREELRVPIDGGKYELHIPAGTPLSAELSTTGDVRHPRLRYAHLASDGRITVRTVGESFFQELTLDMVQILPGGRLKFKYDLGAEAGLHALFVIAGMALDPASVAVGTDPQTPRQTTGLVQAVLNNPPRLLTARERVDAMLEEQVTPRFRAFLEQFDHAIPGYSLLDIVYGG